MSRWEPDPRGRLTQAALDLYDAQGFDTTTVAQIAERAGLTERTFFRHFTDKREVLFSGEIHDILIDRLAGAPASAGPLEAVLGAIEAGGARLDERRQRSRQRQALIDAHPSLRERELIKHARLAEEMAAIVRRRGADDVTATLAAELGIAVYRTATARWMHDDNLRTFSDVLRDTSERLGAVAVAA